MIKGQSVKTAWVNSPQADAVARFYTEGHSVKETAEMFGVSMTQVNNLVKKRGITNGRRFKTDAVHVIKHNKSQQCEAEQRLASRLESLGFEYVGGYQNKRVKIRCQQCGFEFERCLDFAKHGNVVCRKCEHEKALIRQAKRKEAQKAEVEHRRIERLVRSVKNPYEDLHNEFLDRSGVCEICGKSYTVREYVESCRLKQARNNGVCSEKCRRIKANQQVRDSRKRRGVRDSHRHRAMKYGCAYDSSVTLKKLIKRDGLRCAICGEMCNPNDHSWSEYSGPMYPSIDHIIPMAKGGGHIWSNVQVAHIICNSEKGASIDEEIST